MSKISILVRNINNLTDARYFAAWQPDYLALSRSSDVSKTTQILDALTPWIEGPQWAIELPARLSKEIEVWIGDCDKMGIKAIICNSYHLKFLQDISTPLIIDYSEQEAFQTYEFSGHTIVLSPTQSLSIAHQNDLPKIYIQITCVEDWKRIAPIRSKIHGIVLSGGDEEKVGWKSFDQVDEILELIHDNSQQE